MYRVEAGSEVRTFTSLVKAKAYIKKIPKGIHYIVEKWMQFNREWKAITL